MTRMEIDTPFGPVTADLDELSENLSYLVNKVKKTDKVDQAIADFLELNDDNSSHPIESKRKYYHDRSYIFWMEALMGVIDADYEIMRAENYNYGDTMTAPIWFDEKVGETTVKVPHKLVMYVKSKTDESERFVVMFTPFDEYEVDTVFQFRSGCFNYADFWDQVEHYFYNKGLLKGAHFSADFKMLETEVLDWSDIIIKPKDRNVLERNLVRFIDSVELFKSKGLRGSRGVLLAGPPGTGKTLSCKVLMNEIDATVMYVARDAVTEVGQITELYKMARRLSPSVVILEDIDTLGGLGRDEADHPLLGEFLNCLAGVEDNNGVVTLATTNHPEKLDWALTDRPGRFDVRLEFDYPDSAARLAILKKYLTPFETKKLNLKSITKRTEKFSGAYLQEIVQSSFMLAHEACGYCDNPVIEQEHLETCLTQMEAQRHKVSKEKNLNYSGSEITFEELYN
jgi:AAA+ superfamily predicted ATPase